VALPSLPFGQWNDQGECMLSTKLQHCDPRPLSCAYNQVASLSRAERLDEIEDNIQRGIND
jgi:hypothetical protein